MSGETIDVRCARKLYEHQLAQGADPGTPEWDDLDAAARSVLASEAAIVLHAAGHDVLRSAVSDLIEATDPWMNDAAPQEQMNGLWLDRFELLSIARARGRAAVQASAAEGGRSDG